MSFNVRYEQVLVLYASQTGNSEQAAEQLCKEIPKRLSSPSVIVSARSMQLDDFLERRRCRWTRLVVVVLSSYGVGQAPLGGYRFREFCDTLLESPNQTLRGLQFALLGLGDSKFTTFFQNPTKTEKALTWAGATRVGPLGKADASGKGEDEQLKVIAKWIDGIWGHLQLALYNEQEPLSKARLQKMQDDSFEICMKINPDLIDRMQAIKADEAFRNKMLLTMWLSCVGMLIFVYYFAMVPQMNKNGDISEGEL